jgi:prepilin-type N-terminal cleavage/methylation domain-containing protein/prepilin-type processing-associated H-X9-DG protein
VSRRSCRAFTLGELIVVISIVGLLVAILTPGFVAVHKYAHQIQCAGNLNRIGVALHTLSASDEIRHSGSLSVAGWRGQIMPYISQAKEVLLCPDGRSTGMTAEILGGYALRTYSGSTFLYDMPLAEGPACRRENVRNNGMTYDLSFEDQRTSTGGPTGDFSFANPVLNIQFMGTDVKITVKGGGGAYHWYLIDPQQKVVMPDILKTGPGVGGFVMVTGAAGEFSYGLNSVLASITSGSKRIVGLDYPTDVVRVAGADEIRDNWLTWMDADGSYSFARHFKRCNVLMADGGVVKISPQEMDPTDPALLAKYWQP